MPTFLLIKGKTVHMQERQLFNAPILIEKSISSAVLTKAAF
jgi:hypothetical protein